MWDGALDGPADPKANKDLTNIKLAKNQLVCPFHLRLSTSPTYSTLRKQGVGSISSNLHPLALDPMLQFLESSPLYLSTLL